MFSRFLKFAAPLAVALGVTSSPRAAHAQTQVFADEFNSGSLNTNVWHLYEDGYFTERTEFGLAPTFGSDSDGTKFVRLPLQSYNPNSGSTGKNLHGTQIFSWEKWNLGQGMEFEARIRSKSLPPGLVIGFFTYGDAGEWQSTYQKTEIDYELLTQQGGNKMWLNIWDDWNPIRSGPNSATLTSQTGLNWNDGSWNTFLIRWLPGGKTEWVVNGKVARTETTVQPGSPQAVAFNIWAASSGWGTAYNSGIVTPTDPSKNQTWVCDVDYVRVRKLTTTSQGSIGTGTGLTGNYYDNADFTGTQVNRIDPRVDFNWGDYLPTPGFGNDDYSVRWTGFVQPQYTQTYTFTGKSDDGIRLWVNNQKLIDNWVNQNPTEKSGTIALTAGQKYPITVEYYDHTGGAVAQLFWSSASTAKQLIPQSQLYPANPPAAPAFSPAGGSYSAAQSVKVTGSTTGASIRYTTDGTTPTVASPSLSNGGTVVITTSKTLKAAAYLATSGLSSVTSATYTIAADVTAPSVTVSSPAANATVSALPTFKGTAADNTGGTGMDRVELVLRRASDNARWNGSAWIASDWGLPCTLSGSNWTCTGTMPTGTALVDGSYYAKAVAFDKAGNANVAEVGFKLSRGDKVAPTVKVTSPATGSTVTSLTIIKGICTDTGSGMKNVDVVILRKSDNKIWSGWVWATTNTAIPSKISGTAWTASAPLSNGGSMPSGSNLTPGGYKITAVGYDNAGNIKTYAVDITVAAAAAAESAPTDPSQKSF